MFSIRNPNPTQKPPFGSYIDWSHPLAKGLVGCWIFNEAEGNRVNDLTLNVGVCQFTGSPTWAVEGIDCANDDAGVNIGNNNIYNFTSDDFTILVDINPIGAAQTAWGAFLCRGLYTADGYYLQLDDSTDRDGIYFVARDTDNEIASGASILNIGKWNTIVGRKTNYLDIFHNGKEISYAKHNAIGTIASSTRNLYLGRYDATGTDFDGKIRHATIWRIGLLDSDIEWLYAEPYCFIAWPSHRVIFDFGSSGATATNLFDGKICIKDAAVNLLDGKTNIKDSATVLLDGKAKVSNLAVNLLDGKMNVKSSISNLLDGAVDVKDSAVAVLDGKTDIKDSSVLLLDGKTVVNSSADVTNLLDGKVNTKDSLIKLLDGKTYIVAYTTNLLDGKAILTNEAENTLDGEVNIKDVLINLLDGKARIKNSVIDSLDGLVNIGNLAVSLLDGKASIKSAGIDLFDGKTRIKDSAVDLLDGKATISDIATLLLDGKTIVNSSTGTTDLLDGKATVKDSTIKLFDGKTHIVIHAIDLLDGKVILSKEVLNTLDGKACIKEAAYSLLDGKTRIKEACINSLDGLVDINKIAVIFLDGKVVSTVGKGVNLLDGKIDIIVKNILTSFLSGKLILTHLYSKLCALNYNILSKGTTQYLNYDFNSMVKFGDSYLGCNENGIFELRGNNDDGRSIDAWVKLLTTDFGVSNPKKCRAGYIGYETQGELDVKVQADEGPEYVAILPVHNGQQGRKFPISRNIRGRYITFTVLNVNGCDFGIDSMDVCVIITPHKL